MGGGRDEFLQPRVTARRRLRLVRALGSTREIRHERHHPRFRANSSPRSMAISVTGDMCPMVPAPAAFVVAPRAHLSPAAAGVSRHLRARAGDGGSSRKSRPPTDDKRPHSIQHVTTMYQSACTPRERIVAMEILKLEGRHR
jgi:hypothetical protein